MPIIRTFAFDADGCIYNQLYFDILLGIVERNWDLINRALVHQKQIETTRTRLHIIKASIPLTKQLVSDARQAEHIDKLKKEEENLFNELHRLELEETNFFTEFAEAAKHEQYHPTSEIRHPKVIVAWNKMAQQFKKLPKDLINNQNLLTEFLSNYVPVLNKYAKHMLSTSCYIANQKLISFCVQQSMSASVIPFVGLATNRQSLEGDLLAIRMNGTGSIYIDSHCIQAVMESELAQTNTNKRCYLNKFTLADVYLDLPKGAHFDAVVNAHSQNNYENSNQNKFIFDENKLTNIYGLSHDIVSQIAANAKKDEVIDQCVLDFFDDKLSILYKLKFILEVFPELLPKGLTLNLQHYDGEHAKLIAVIHGAGPVDHNYRNNIKKMAAMYFRCDQLTEEHFSEVMDTTHINIPQFLHARNINQPAQSSLGNHAALFNPTMVNNKINNSSVHVLKHQKIT